MSITLEEAKSKIKNVSDGKVAAAYRLAQERKPSSRYPINLKDVKRALESIEGTRHLNKPKDFFEKLDELSAKRSAEEIKILKDAHKKLDKDKKTSGVIRRRGGGIAKRGFGIVK